ncbi:MAG: class IV adenylate cyclase [Proteobacteria bacterium]|jgi:adenylate cyclase class 2|nr:class IV adenylate cyclase [Pseudomonadota bacterium]
MLEVEAKFIVDSFDLLEAKYQFDGPVLQRDIYYQHPSRDFMKTGEWFRVRRIFKGIPCAENLGCEEIHLCHKGSNQGSSDVKSRREIEFSVPMDIIELLQILDFAELIRVEKYRRSAVVTPTNDSGEPTFTITLDEVLGLGKYVEIEMLVLKEEFKAGAIEAINDIAKKLGLTQPEKHGYAKLMLKKEKK